MSLGRDILLALVIIIIIALLAYFFSWRSPGGYTFWQRSYVVTPVYQNVPGNPVYQTPPANVTVVQPAPAAEGNCYIGGCSGQICSDTPGAISTCEYRASYACYQGARCERQANGSCGWTMTATLAQCLASANNTGVY
jgi:hypothetical protein